MPATQESLFPTSSEFETVTRELAVETFWQRVFSVAPLVIVGSKDTDGTYDLAPKHMAMPLGWRDGYGFVCTPRHRTYRNIERHGVFTVSFPRSFQIVQAALAATSREPDGTKPALAALPTFLATRVDGVLVHGCYAFLECELDRFVEIDDASLVIGRIVAAAAVEEAIRDPDRDDAELLRHVAPLAYLSPSRFATVDHSQSFPFPSSFRR
ncbi:MAG TPA: flavin reductase [Gaiellaceae bacterium]|jgi:flavin reductase (DIM6/NTAB) family NADH-FMN oxidoreductase RutF